MKRFCPAGCFLPDFPPTQHHLFYVLDLVRYLHLFIVVPYNLYILERERERVSESYSSDVIY